MYLNFNVVIGIGILVLFVFVFWTLHLKSREKKAIKIRDAYLTCEELEEHARKTACDHVVSEKAAFLNWPLPRMNENYGFINSVYRELNEDVQKKRTIPPAAEWLLDNFYIIEEQVKSIRRELSREDYARLPNLICGPLKGYARVYAIAMELVSHTDAQIDEKVMLNYLKAYQSHNILSDREIWAMLTMMRLALIENIRFLCERIKETQIQWRKADDIADSLLESEDDDPEKLLKAVENSVKSSYEVNSAFVEHLAYRLRRAGRNYTKLLGYMDDLVARYGTMIAALTQKEHDRQAVNAVSIGNCITSLKYISTLDWIDVFESLSYVEQVLNQDPDGTYPRMDLPSRSHYRKKIEELAASLKVSEMHIAKEAVELARAACSSGDACDGVQARRLRHVGYYIVGQGVQELEKKLGFKPTTSKRLLRALKSHPTPLYLGLITFFTLCAVLLAAVYTYYSAASHALGYAILAAVALLVPMSDIAVNLVNWLMCSIFKPSVFPRLELKDGIPDELRTMVAIPVLLPDAKRAEELLENLESHYLSNKEANLYFALVGDFKDSPNEKNPEDDSIINAAMAGIKELNQKYAGEGEEIFFYFHRKRQFNPRQNKWMGWERKRGAIIEFNDLLLGSETTSYTIASSVQLPSGIKYVITLDADTIVPLDGAKKMIGTIAHPLNKAFIDRSRGIVTEGYGLIQPRIVFDVESADRSLFARIFTGQEGIDPYASAVSDVYQDLFGEGIFTGKGIYELQVFQDILKTAIPENTVLSHDLLEGSYIRAGLASDIELVDCYPSRYNSYASRLHRWVRGDWQLVHWLTGRVPDINGRFLRNPLSLISRWKIFDNLRRSLVAPSLMLLVLLSFLVLPGNILFWLVLVACAAAFQLIISALNLLLSKRVRSSRLKRHLPVISGIKAVALQVLTSFIFLPYQAYLMAHAVISTLARVFFTKKNMLEWVTAADVEKGQKNSPASYWRKMSPAVFISLLLILLTALHGTRLILPAAILAVIWASSPFVAYWISRPENIVMEKLPDSDLQELRRISRKTWRYFEEFMNHRNHYLPPDNFQEDPPNGLAGRTSPTNIGLGLLSALTARDLGFICTHELLDILTNTVNTIEGLEKWNGHLYNWYDTRTLQPLRPRYISTVDSGNFVGYLITLVQGLKEYMERPLVEPVYVEGLFVTFDLAGSSCTKTIEQMKEAFAGITPDLLIWRKTLDKLAQDSNLNARKSRWKSKADHMVSRLRSELWEFMPWLDLLEAVPSSLTTAEILAGGNDPSTGAEPAGSECQQVWMSNSSIIQKLKSNMRLKDYPAELENVLKSIDSSMNFYESVQDSSSAVCLEWLSGLKTAVSKSRDYSIKLLENFTVLIERIDRISKAMSFAPLYVEKKHLFSIGYNIEENRLTNSYYDLLASEARQTSYIAIARREIPAKHWSKLGRTLTTIDHYKGLVSWTGTMFEYLMPCLIMKSYRNTLLDETYSFVIRSQKKYSRQRRVPWGASESGFYSLDINLDYQYKAIGVPWLGLKRGLIEDMVVAPYATFLALSLDPRGSMENIRRLKEQGLDGPYGFYEAVDYTPERIPFGQKHAIIKSFMAHHQGMSLLSLNNYLNNTIMQHRFHSDPVMKAAQLLLQEKVPTNVVFTKENKEKVMPFKDIVYKERGPQRKYTSPDALLPKVHVLSNGNYSVMVTDRGTGYSRIKNAAVTRWREDISLDNYGMFFYIRNVETGRTWSAAYAPYNILPAKYEVVFTSDKAAFKRLDGSIETLTEITVASGDNAEIRRLSFKNLGKAPCTLEVTSYFEVVLAPHSADIAHPAFSNLFVRTEYSAEYRSIIANRRPRSENEKGRWICHSAAVDENAVGSIQYETDRAQFIGRGHTIAEPVVLLRNKPLSETTGPVLDPIMSLRVRIRLDPGQTGKISFITAVSETRDSILELLEKYHTPEAADSAFRLALTRSQVEARYLNMKPSEIELYQDIISHIVFISPMKKLYQEYTKKNVKGQSALWAYGISGDLPIILVAIKKPEDIDIAYEVLRAHEYWRIKEVKSDIVLLNEEEGSYTHPLHSLIGEVVSSSHAHDIMGKPGGVFILNRNSMPEEDITLLYSAARIVLKGDGGSLSQQVMSPAKPYRTGLSTNVPAAYPRSAPKPLPELDFYNGLGGFTKDGSEYVIHLEKGHYTPMPWINVISNRNFGFMVSESGSGCTWYENSHENKITPWSNDPLTDPPGEVIYLYDAAEGVPWSITPLPIREEEAYTIRHGFGYTTFEHDSHGIAQELYQFAPVDQPVKISIVRLKNHTPDVRRISVTYYIRPVLGVSDQTTAMHIYTELDSSGIMMVRNPYNDEFAAVTAFMDSSVAERSITGDRQEFLGRGSISYPEALTGKSLSGNVGAGFDPCAAMQVFIDLAADEVKEIVFLLGMGKSAVEIRDICGKYRNIPEAFKALQEVKEYWHSKLDAIQVETPDSSMNMILNGWLLYQVVSCRLWARSAFYQSGGAFGFRDQLQDSLSVAHILPEIALNQILLHSSHQFVEGDVLHWWHEPKSKGIRTRFSDDLLWLPYITAEYVRVTGDYSVLERVTPFIEAEQLMEYEDEKYIVPSCSKEEATVYEHCIRAIEKALKFGEHGIPLIGSGDWNDGMNTVGNRGKGESVWLAWFIYSTLRKFAPLCRHMKDAGRAERYEAIAAETANAVERNAWDGSWYIRAYFDNGTPLGSSVNAECKIDSISQSWSVISEAGDQKRSRQAMDSVEDYLVQRDEGLIKLLTPPFDESELEPGYIKGYVPGVRENGGQYTHAAAWVIIAFAKLGEGNKAWELFELINPINHTRTHMECSKYKVEPYVMPADVYAVPPHVGRGGWTWYTGSAGWVYRAGLEFILGFQKNGDSLSINPCIPSRWTEYTIKYRYMSTLYEIKVVNPYGVSTGVKSTSVDGVVTEGSSFKLVDDGGTHTVEVVMGAVNT